MTRGLSGRGRAAAAGRTLRHHLGTARLVVRDPRLPRWLKGLALFAVLPIPGPVDEAVALLVLLLVAVRHRGLVLEHHRRGRGTDGDPGNS